MFQNTYADVFQDWITLIYVQTSVENSHKCKLHIVKAITLSCNLLKLENFSQIIPWPRNTYHAKTNITKSLKDLKLEIYTGVKA